MLCGGVFPALARTPSITRQPADTAVAAGVRAKFSVTSTGTMPLAYRWMKDGTIIAGATNASYTTPVTTTADNGALFAVIVSNSAGSVTSNNAMLTVATAPLITEQPINEAVTAERTATFNVNAIGVTPFQYQWARNGANIAGATKGFYTTPATTRADNGAVFAVTVNNSAGSVISNTVTLTVHPAPAPTPTVTPPPVSTRRPINHVFIVMEENHSYSEIIGSGAMPYLQSLADQYGLATNYYANTHPSIGNYFMLTTGQIITNDDNYTLTVPDDNIVRHLIAAGKTWREYTESLPSVGYVGADTSQYDQHHNPLSYFSDVRNSTAQRQNLVPFTQLMTDMAAGQLPNYGFIVPTNAHNGHDGTALSADQWLQNNIGPLIDTPQFQQDGLLLIIFDEGRKTDTAGGGGQVAWVAVGPSVKPAYVSNALYQQQNTLKTVCDLLGIGSFSSPSLATDAAPAMTEFIKPDSTPTPTPTPTPADLRVTVTDGKVAAVAGRKDNYTIVVTNGGPGDITGAVVMDNFPETFTGITFTATQSGGASGFTGTGAGNISDTVTMPTGSFITYKAAGKVSSSATGTLSDTATVTAPSGVTDPI